MNTWDPTAPITMVAGSFTGLADWIVGGAKFAAGVGAGAVGGVVGGVAALAGENKSEVGGGGMLDTVNKVAGATWSVATVVQAAILLGAVYVFFKYGGKFLKEVL